jgi:N-acetylmuramoyl-L-alanine amidase
MNIPLRAMLVDKSKYKIKCPYAMQPEHITVHNTYNDATAENEVKYMITNNNEVSFHYAVDDKEAIQGIPINRNAWAAGDGGNGKGNRKSIHVEICYSKSGGDRYKKAEDNGVKLVAQLLKEQGWGIDRVKKHQDWSGKYCPHRILAEGRWDEFKKAVEKELKAPKTKKVEVVTVAGKEYKDIANSWGKDSIVKAIEKGIIPGYDDKTWKPNEPIKRADIAVILDRLGLLK